MARNHLTYAVVTIWTTLFVLSFVVAYSLEPTGDGFTRGLNRISALLVLQGIAIAVAVIAWLTGRGIGDSGARWMSRIPVIVHSLIVLLVIGLVLALRFTQPPIEPQLPPGPATAPAAVAPVAVVPAELAGPTEQQAELRQYSGIFRGGFEASHFYTMDGQGPWWLEVSDANRERINASYVDGPGRTGSVTAALTVTGWLDPTGVEFAHLGIDEYRLHVVSIEGIRALSEQEFELVLDSITRR